MNLSSSEIEKVAAHWSEQRPWEVGRGRCWLELPAVQERVNVKVSGRPEVDWVSYTLERYFAGRLPLGRCLSLGCGEGGLERRLAGLAGIVACDAFDVAPGSIAHARRLAQEAGYGHIHYAVQDVNRIILPARTYDAVWVAGAAHHFDRLEHVFRQMAAALKPEGLIVLWEYVGPNRFQFPARQRQIIQACSELLPSAFRRLAPEITTGCFSVRRDTDPSWVLRRVIDKLREGDLIAAATRRLRLGYAARTHRDLVRHGARLPTESSVKATDPSEAVRSADILTVLRQHFSIVELKPLGGAILQFLLADIAGNFHGEAGKRLLEMLFAAEDALMAVGEIESDFVYIVAAPRAVEGAGGRGQ